MAKKTANRPGLFARLKQHHMFRVASWYATAAYVLILAANAIFPDIGYTREDVRYLIAGLALGFPIVLVLAWMFIPPSKEDPQTFGRWQRLRWRLGSATAVIVIAFVVISGVYLWHLDVRHLDRAPAGSAAIHSVTVMPFERIGSVDQGVVEGLRATMESELSGLGYLRVVSGDGGASTRPPAVDWTVKGTIQRADAHTDYTLHMDLVAADTGAVLYSDEETYPAAAQAANLEQQIATNMAGPIDFLSRGDAWLAKGFNTPADPQAMTLLRSAVASHFYSMSGDPQQFVRGALRIAPDFAQALAYDALFMIWNDESNVSHKNADDEIKRALALAPGLPEAALARGTMAFQDQDFGSCVQILGPVEAPLAQNFWLHAIYGRALHHLGRYEDALRQIKIAVAIDPFNMYYANYAALIQYSERDYEAARDSLLDAQQKWPLSMGPRLWLAQVEFAERGDVGRLASVVDGDWDAFTADDAESLPARRIEVAELQGRHAEVLRLLKNYASEYLRADLFRNILDRLLAVDSMSVESLRLLRRDKEAADLSRLSLPSAFKDQVKYHDTFASVHIALLQAFGGDPTDALQSIEPLLGRLHEPPASWSGDDANWSTDAAVILAWSGKKQEAIGLLKESLTVFRGAHAAILAHDPVWRPLYTEPAFAALLAAHGQKLAYMQ